MIYTNTNKSKLKAMFKPMIALDKNRNVYMCACKTNVLVEGSKHLAVTFSKRIICIPKPACSTPVTAAVSVTV